MKKVKKTLLSLSLILTFGAYTIFTRNSSTQAPFTLPPETNSQKISTPTTLANTTTPKPKSKPSTTPPPINTGKYKNGIYVGEVADAYYGNVQVQVTITDGKMSDVQFLDYPHDRQNSVRINSRAVPALRSEAIRAQDANVNTVSGASFTSAAFSKSLGSALDKALI